MVFVLGLSCESSNETVSDSKLTEAEEIIAQGTPVSLAKVFGVQPVKTVCSGEWGGGSATVFENKKGDVFVHVDYPNGSVITARVYVSSSYMCSVLFNRRAIAQKSLIPRRLRRNKKGSSYLYLVCSASR